MVILEIFGNSLEIVLDRVTFPSQTSKMELFAKIINGFQLLNIFAKISILDVRLGFEYASAEYI